ncbi:MAG: quinone oxidoreductase family protein [Solirubrobacterales bacterium]
MKAIQVTEFGGPEVLQLVEVDDPVAPEGALLIDVSAVGVNYADTHQVENSYLAPSQLPLIPGGEAVGTTADGRRVVALLAGGGYAEKAVAWPQVSWDVPEAVSDGQALTTLIQGSTAWHLLKTSARMSEGESVVVHAAGGGVGTIAVQLAKRWGAGNVIASASSDEKRELALELGADVAVDSRADDMKAALVEANGGKKVDIILDMVGGPTFDQGLKALAPFGRMVAYGQAGRVAPQPIDPGMLMGTSRAVIGFWLVHAAAAGMMDESVNDLLSLIESGELKVIVGDGYPLAEARAAHEALRSRGTTGKLILTV